MPNSRKKIRHYESPLRARQVAETRERIVEKALDLLIGEGGRDLSLPRIARELRISAPTVYRHFPTLDTLLEAIAGEIATRLNVREKPGDLPELARERFRAFDANEKLVRARNASPQIRDVYERARRGYTDKVLLSVRTKLSYFVDDEDSHAMAALVRLLVHSAAWQTLKDDGGLSGDEAGRVCAWAIRVLMNELEQHPRSMKKEEE